MRRKIEQLSNHDVWNNSDMYDSHNPFTASPLIEMLYYISIVITLLIVISLIFAFAFRAYKKRKCSNNDISKRFYTMHCIMTSFVGTVLLIVTIGLLVLTLKIPSDVSQIKQSFAYEKIDGQTEIENVKEVKCKKVLTINIDGQERKVIMNKQEDVSKGDTIKIKQEYQTLVQNQVLKYHSSLIPDLNNENEIHQNDDNYEISIKKMK